MSGNLYFASEVLEFGLGENKAKLATDAQNLLINDSDVKVVFADGRALTLDPGADHFAEILSLLQESSQLGVTACVIADDKRRVQAVGAGIPDAVQEIRPTADGLSVGLVINERWVSLSRNHPNYIALSTELENIRSSVKSITEYSITPVYFYLDKKYDIISINRINSDIERKNYTDIVLAFMLRGLPEGSRLEKDGKGYGWTPFQAAHRIKDLSPKAITAIDKLHSAVMAWNYDPLVNERAKTSLHIPFYYPSAGCHARAHRACQILTHAKGEPFARELDYTVKKIWIYDGKQGDAIQNIKLETPNDPACKVAWDFHVSPAIEVREGGKAVLIVIDPSIDNKKVKDAENWCNDLAPKPPFKADIFVSNSKLFIWSNVVGSEGFHGIDPKDESKFTGQLLWAFNTRLRYQVRRHGSPPYKQCLHS